MTLLKKFSKSITSLALCLSLALCSPSPCASQSYPNIQDEAIKTATSYLYVREAKNDNRSPDIDRWLKNIGLPVGNPYCAAFMIWCYSEASKKLNKTMPLPKIGRVSTLWKTCQKNPYKYKTFKAARVFQKIDKLEPADIPAWAHGSPEGNFNGHTGLVLTQIDNNTFTSIEGNTGSGNTGSQREGNGVFKRTRKLDLGKTFQVVGFIRVK